MLRHGTGVGTKAVRTNILRGPDQQDFDIVIAKTTPLTERARLILLLTAAGDGAIMAGPMGAKPPALDGG